MAIRELCCCDAVICVSTIIAQTARAIIDVTVINSSCPQLDLEQLLMVLGEYVLNYEVVIHIYIIVVQCCCKHRRGSLSGVLWGG
jgi:hypothetical protein